MPPDYEIPELDLSELIFVELLQEPEDLSDKYRKEEYRRACVSRARWQEKDCIVKVFHPTPPGLIFPAHRQVDPFTNETRAYSRLKARGFCERGDIPDVYGVIKQINPASEGWGFLRPYFEDGPRPNAIVIEYVPNSRIIDLSNFSDEALRNLRHILTEMHEAWVYHGDPYPRNMLLQEGSGRALWIDFGSAQTYAPGIVTERQRSWFVSEVRLMDEFIEELTFDHKLGKIYKSLGCYTAMFDPPEGYLTEEEQRRADAIEQDENKNKNHGNWK
ncbi:uncharacterized protein N7498_010955 [Penicillium cinerascens]|uniref:Protein kinase domain-containing protein n=1 Tax=Penicillium cinerascens TaxID=70096 RepID=A0A9W9JBN3_9EURO|nr:uncharacterized protein N7498_010955 [Penicillium cinerascens]KAJ5191970.1 hypothetical protein N7498_010955 [Penicillium cinerascens]